MNHDKDYTTILDILWKSTVKYGSSGLNYGRIAEDIKTLIDVMNVVDADSITAALSRHKNHDVTVQITVADVL